MTTAGSVEPNRYSPNWFTSFMEHVPDETTALEVDAITHHLPRSRFPRVLDAGCGGGRITLPLVDLGYQMTGVDRDRHQLDLARAQLGERQARFIAVDLRDLSLLRGPFDAIACLGQSFGYFESTINDAILGDMADLLRPQGRLVLDMFHPGYFAAHQGTHAHPAPGVTAVADHVEAGRLRSVISYDDGSADLIDVELVEPDGLVRRAAQVDLDLVVACSQWDATRSPSADAPSYQLVLERL